MLRLVTAARRSKTDEPALSIAREFADPHLELMRLLHEACEIEHSLMLQYLYGAFSVKEPHQARIAGTPGDHSDGLLGVAVQEMLHLRDVNRMLVALGGEPNLHRQDFPYDPQIYPFPMELERLTRASLAKYIYAEAPARALKPSQIADPADRAFAERVLALLPDEARMNHIGTLYRSALVCLDELPPEQRSPAVERAKAAILEICRQGEELHFRFLKRVFLEPSWDDPSSDAYPSQPVATNPSALRGRPGGITDPALLTLAKLGNLHYWILLSLLDAAYRLPPDARETAKLTAHAFLHMRAALHPLSMELARAGSGMPFDVLSTGYAQRSGLPLTMDLLREAQRLARVTETDAGRRSLAVVEEGLADLGTPNGRRVAVIGSGPAGLAAAVALSTRGYRVEIFERAPVPAGKVHSFRDDQGRSIEHGVHGWWINYLNFNRLLELAGVDPAQQLKLADSSILALNDGRTFPLRVYSLRLPSPLFMLLQMLRAPYLKWTDALRMVPFAVHLLAFRHEQDYLAYDGLSFEQLMDRLGVSARMQKLVLGPFIRSFDFTTSERISAACGLSGMQFYILPSQDSILARWARGLPAEKIFDPLIEFVRARGGALHLGRGVSAIARRPEGLVLSAPNSLAAPVREIARTPLSAVPEETFAALSTAAGPAFVRRRANGFLALSARCTHQGCNVNWTDARERFVCPCHGGEYDVEGTQVREPPVAPLPKFGTRVEGDELVLEGADAAVALRFDAVVLAADLEGAKSLLAATPECPARLRENLAKLDTTPVIVVRMWLAADTPIPETLETALTPDAPFADNVFFLNRFDPSYDAEGKILEVQSYRVFSWLDRSDEEILQQSIADLSPFCRSLSRERVLHFQVNRHRALFTRYAPGLAALRPGANSGLGGLHLAGDWTEADHSVWMMERAVVSGLRAANSVIADGGEAPFPILRLPREGWLLRFSRFSSRLCRGLFWRGGPPG